MLLRKNESSGKQFKTVPAGSHLARLYKIVDVGTQMNDYQGQITYPRKVIFFFEIHGEDSAGKPLTTDDGKPLSVMKEYTATLNEKGKLSQMLKQWLAADIPDPFDPKELLGKFGMVNVSNTTKGDRIYANLDGVSPVPTVYNKMGLPDGFNDLLYFSMEKFDSVVYESFPNWIKEKIQKSPEFRKIAGGGTPQKSDVPADFDDRFNDEVPF